MFAICGAFKSRFCAFTFCRRIYPYFKPYRVQCATALAALLGVHLVEVVIPLCLKAAIDLIARYDKGVIWPTVGIVGLVILRFIILSFGRHRNALVSVNLSGDLRQALYTHLQTLDRSFYARYPLGDLMARATNDIATIQRFFRFSVHQLASLVGVILIAPIFIAMQSSALVLLLLPLLLAMILVGWQIAAHIRQASERVQASYGALTETVQQNLRGIRTIHSLGQEEREIRYFSGVAKRYAVINEELARWNAALATTMTFGSGLMSLLVIGVGGNQVLKGNISIGTLSAFIVYLAMILGVIKSCSAPLCAFINASAAAARVFQIMDEKAEIDDEQAEEIPRYLRGAITVRNVSFRYPAGAGLQGPLILKDLSLSIQPGEMVAIVGRIGSGKSTLLNLMARRLECSTGYIAVDDHDLRTVPLGCLRRHLSFATQDTFLFATSVAENVSYDDPLRPSEPVWAAARAAQLEATIEALGEGLSTCVGERGMTLSGGQKQRIGLARSLIRQTPILLLDDAFSSLDAATAAGILARLRVMRRGLTTIIVSHRTSIASHADRIFVLEQGQIAETGSHQQLTAMGGRYAELIRMHDDVTTVQSRI